MSAMVKIYFDHQAEMGDSLLSVVDDNQLKMQKFQSLVHKTQDFVSSIDLAASQQLHNWDPDYKRKLDHYDEDLKRESEKRAIVIVGDTSAGKSSLINLLFGEDIFPVSHLHTTSTICRVYASEEKKITPWIRGLGKQSEVRWSDIPELKDWLKNNITPKRSGASKKECPYQYVDIYLPTTFIKDPLFLVDTPGTGKDETISGPVLNYIENAAGFVCVLNVANAGGIREKGLRDILKRIKKNSAKTMLGFDPQSAVFVFNKWDTVPKEEQEEVRTSLVEELKELWPDVLGDNILFFSVPEHSQQDMEKFLSMINRMVNRSLSANFENCKRWLLEILKRCCQDIPHVRDGRTHLPVDLQAERAKTKVELMQKLVLKFEDELNNNVKQTSQAISEEYQLHIKGQCFVDLLDKLKRTYSENSHMAMDESNRSQEIRQNAEKRVNDFLTQELADIMKKHMKKNSTEKLRKTKEEIAEYMEELQSIELVSGVSEERTSFAWFRTIYSRTASGVKTVFQPKSLVLVAAFAKGSWLAPGFAVVSVITDLFQYRRRRQDSTLSINALIDKVANEICSSITIDNTRQKAQLPVKECVLACVDDLASAETAIDEFDTETLERWLIQRNASIQNSKSKFTEEMLKTVENQKKILDKMTYEQKRNLLMKMNAFTRKRAQMLFEEVKNYQ